MKVTENNPLAHDLLAATFAYQGKTDEAIAHCKLLLAIDPHSAAAHHTWGLALEKKEDGEQALAHLRRAVELEPAAASFRYDLAQALVRQGHAETGVALLSEAAQFATNSAARAEIQRQIGLLLSEQGKYEEAAAHYAAALRANPRLAAAHNDWGVDLAAQRQLAAAAEHFAEALKLDPQYAVAHRNLASALIAANKLAEARAHLYEAIRLQPGYVSALNDLAWLLATCRDGNLRDAHEALRLAKRATELTDRKDAGVLETLAAAYAEKGQFDAAIRTVEEAIPLCDAASQKELLATLQHCRQHYRAGQPLRQ